MLGLKRSYTWIDAVVLLPKPSFCEADLFVVPRDIRHKRYSIKTSFIPGLLY
jgi:hypothetical protein